MDVYGFCVPPIADIFPHLKGEILGFGRQHSRFEQFQKHHILVPSGTKGLKDGQEYDLTIFNIVKFFNLLLENNPNMVDVLFVPQRCVLYATQIGQLLRENRKTFLHKGSWHKFKGYAYSQLHKMSTKTPVEGSKRFEDVQEHGFDTKFSYHVVRLLLEVEQILTKHDLDLECNSEQLKAIRRGEWDEQRIRDFFAEKEKTLESVYHASTLRYEPDQDAIKKLLIQCLEIVYGPLSSQGAYHDTSDDRKLLLKLKGMLENI
jgi:predicted nucleotidyltransferase